MQFTGQYEYSLDAFVCPSKPFDNGSSITCSDAQTLLTTSVSAGPNSTRTSTHSERTEMAENSFVPKKVSSIFVSSTKSVDGSSPSENIIQPGFLTPTSALASSASVETRILQFLTINSLQNHPGTQEPFKLRATLSLPLIPSASRVLLEGIITLNSATALSTNSKDILLQSETIPKHRSEPIKQSTLQQTSTATRLFLESKVTFQSTEILATNPLKILPRSTHHQSSSIRFPSQHPLQNTTLSIKQLNFTEYPTKLISYSWHSSSSIASQQNTVSLFHVIAQTSWNPIEQSANLGSPTKKTSVFESAAILKPVNSLTTTIKTTTTTTTNVLESAGILKSSTTKITNQEPRLTNKLPQRINTAQTSSHSVEQSSSLNLPRTTTSIYENAAILRSSMKMITKQELSITSALPHKNNKTPMQMQPMRTTQRSLATSLSNNSKGNVILLSVCSSLEKEICSP